MNLLNRTTGGLLFLLGLCLGMPSPQANEKVSQLHVGGSADSNYNISIADIEILIGLLFKEKFEDQEMELNIKVFDTDLELSQQLSGNRLDAAFMSPLVYLENLDYLSREHTYAVKHGTSIATRYLLLTRNNSGLEALTEVCDKKLIVPSGHKVGQRYLDIELMKAGLPTSERCFSEIRYTNDANSAVIQLFFGQVDVALITNFTLDVAVELNPQIGRSIQSILISDPYVHQVISLRKNFPPELIDRYMPFTEMLNDDPRMAFLRRSFRFEGIEKLSDHDLAELKRLDREHKALISQRPEE